MPFIQVHLAAGRSEEQKRALLLAISDAVQSSIGAPLESIRVWISEFGREEFVVAGRIAADGDHQARRDPV
jgi:4-oxalocrotonate tautomerase